MKLTFLFKSSVNHLIIFFSFFFELCLSFSSASITNLAILYCNFLLALLIESFTLANVSISCSALHALINDISASIFIKCLLLSSKEQICFNTSCLCFPLISLNMLIRAYSLITNKKTRSFNMVLLGEINNSN